MKNTPPKAVMFSWFLILLVGAASGAEDAPFLDSELIFPLEHWHNHSSSIVELPSGDLLVVWFHGSGERTADDVVLLGSRKKAGRAWSKPFLMEDVPGFPDTNCVLFIDPEERLWLFWPTILANEWHTALLKYRVSRDYQKDGAPAWEISRVLHLKPGDKFVETVDRRLDEIVAGGPPDVEPERIQRYIQQNRENARDKLFRRLGWMTRTHPLALDGGRILVPLYSDGFSFSLIAYSDDGGKHWDTSTPIVGVGSIQPTLALRNDGTLVAYMRDNGPAPKRLHYSTSRDHGETWGAVLDTEIPNPGSSAEVLVLENGSWILVHNDLEQGRYQLAVALSEDEGRSWRWKRYLERDQNVGSVREAGQYHYPSVIQASDGSIHVTYSYFLPENQADTDEDGRLIRKSIKHARFNEAWIKGAEEID